MNAAVNAFFLIFKLLSLYFLAVSLFCLCRRKKPAASAGQRRFAILIAARNEESCIAGLIESLQAQRYPRELFDIWVLPNNCTDHTVEAAQRAGARIMEMPSSVRSKGAALQYAADTLLRGQQLIAGKNTLTDFLQQMHIIGLTGSNFLTVTLQKQLICHHLHTAAHLLQQQLAGTALRIYDLYLDLCNRGRKSLLQWQKAYHCSKKEYLIQLHRRA